MRIHHPAAWSILLALLVTGCGQPEGLSLQRLDPKAPAAAGLPPRPGQDQPSPLTERAPFGLYAQYPSGDTLRALSTGTLSPDGRFRTATTQQGAWVTRIDGAWLWQIELPPPTAAAPVQPGSSPQPGQAAQAPQPAQGAKPPAPPTGIGTKIAGSLEWTPLNTLIFQDNLGNWLEADPYSTKIALLPAALKGKEGITFSPDGKQVLYYVPTGTGRQLWLARADGTDPKYQGDNVVGYWDEAGKLVVRKATAPAPGTAVQKPDLTLPPGPNTQ